MILHNANKPNQSFSQSQRTMHTHLIKQYNTLYYTKHTSQIKHYNNILLHMYLIPYIQSIKTKPFNQSDSTNIQIKRNRQIYITQRIQIK